jgi:hypothetical protein
MVRRSTLCDKVCKRLTTGKWFSPGTSVSSINKIDRHDITEILLKVALNTINQPINLYNPQSIMQGQNLAYLLQLLTGLPKITNFKQAQQKILMSSNFHCI